MLCSVIILILWLDYLLVPGCGTDGTMDISSVCVCLFVRVCSFFLKIFFSAKIYPLLLKYKYLSVVEMEWSIFDESQ